MADMFVSRFGNGWWINFQLPNWWQKFPSTESHLSKRKVSPFIWYTSNTFLVMRQYTFNCPVHRKSDPHIWTLTTGQWENHPHLVIIVWSRKENIFPYNIMLKC